MTKACLNVFGIDCQGLKYNSKNSKYCIENWVPKKLSEKNICPSFKIV